MTSSPPSPTPRRRLSRQARREAILAAAATTFAARGYAGTSMADLSDATQVSHLILYRHFASKSEIYSTVLARATDTIDQLCMSPGAIGAHGPTPFAMLAAARAESAPFLALWRHAAHEPDFRHLADAARARLVEVTAVALTPVVADRRLLRWAARATVAYLVEAVAVWLEDGDRALDDRFATATHAALRAGVRSWSLPVRPT